MQMFTSRAWAAKSPFSWCRCHILVIDYRWGSMGSDETAITIPGGPRVIDVFDGTGAIGSKLFTFFGCRSARTLRDRSGVGWSPTPQAPVLKPRAALL